jgi:hypothetical protein
MLLDTHLGIVSSSSRVMTKGLEMQNATTLEKPPEKTKKLG